MASGETAAEAAARLAAALGLRGSLRGPLTEFQRPSGRYALRVAALLFAAEDAPPPGPLSWLDPAEARAALPRDPQREVLRAALAFLLRGEEEPAAATPSLDPDARALFLLEDDAGRVEAMRAALEASELELVLHVEADAPSALSWLETHLAQVALISLDHDLGPSRPIQGRLQDPGSGRDVVDWLAARPACCPVVVHTSNHLAAPGMLWTLEHAGWQVERVVPFDDLAWVAAAWAPALAALARG